MNDLHAHILWGLDDGPAAAEETLQMLRESAKQGVRRIAATVHAAPGFRPFDMAQYAARLEEARSLCTQHGLPIALMPGAEIFATYQLASALRHKTVPTLGNGDYALIELWQHVGWQKAYEIADSVLKVGCIPIFAHVERYSCFLWEPKTALRFRSETGALLQMNGSMLLGKKGFMEKRFIRRMLSEQGIDMLASDMHNMRYRPPNLEQAQQALYGMVDADYARRLTGFEVTEP